MRKLSDTIVIYDSGEDDCWIAHSLRTDQIGTGNCIVAALADLIKAVHQIIELAADDDSIAVLRSAPETIHRMADRATNLPQEIFEIAYRQATGTWPAEIEPAFKPKRKKFCARKMTIEPSLA